jgi:hypothetical protein
MLLSPSYMQNYPMLDKMSHTKLTHGEIHLLQHMIARYLCIPVNTAAFMSCAVMYCTGINDYLGK